MVAYGSEAAFGESNWLESLQQHAIFAPQHTSQIRQCMVVRNSDLIVANGKSLRMTSLLEAKHKHRERGQPGSESFSASSSLPAFNSYKELVADSIDMDILQLVLNPTGKLLAVVGSHKVVIVVLPRTGSDSSRIVGSQVSVKASAVGSYYYHERVGGKSRLASVSWHPWGHLGSSLLVMSKDGLLREFDAAVDVEEPAQTVSLLPSSSRQQADWSRAKQSRSRSKASRARSQTPRLHRSVRSSSRIAFDDDEDENSEEEYEEERAGRRDRLHSATTAVTFTLGIDSSAGEEEEPGNMFSQAADWNPLTVYTLCGNGDIYALCPFMPKNASIPLSYIHSLSSYVSAQTSSASSSSVGNNGDLQTRYISSLLKQARSSQEERPPLSPTTSRASREISAAPMSLDPRASVPPQPEEKAEEEAVDEVVLVHTPGATMVPQQPQPQGPFLLSPAPVELSEDRENASTDLFFARVGRKEASLDLLGVVGDDGRVDLCLSLEPVEPMWMEKSRGTSAEARRVASSGRYALSESDEDDQEGDKGPEEARPLPMLFVYETIDLAIYPSDLVKQGKVAFSSMQPPRFILDPIYSDSVYVQHATGAHALSFGRWSKELIAAMAKSEEERATAMERVLHKGIKSDLVRVVETSGLDGGEQNGVVGLSIISDIYLSYSFLALTHSGALVALELRLRVEGGEQGEEPVGATALLDDSATPPAYRSLLGDGPPFSPPEPFQSLNGLPYHPRTAVKGHHSSGELRVTYESLRVLATVVSTLRGEMRKIVQGGNVVQSRLELQFKELSRQLTRLSDASKRMGEAREREAKLDSRVKRVMEQQGRLVQRSDRLLQKLVENHSPEVSIYERQWFKELERLEEDVGKSRGEERDGLSARVAKLQHQLDTLRPDLERLKRESKGKEASVGMGAKQLQAVETLLAREAQLIALDRDKISRLQSRVQRTSVY